EAGLEGLLLFLIIWTYSSRPRVTGSVSGLFLICYALFRFTVEFFREPDAHLGLVFLDGLSMGQLLCLPMLIAGLWLLLAGRSRQT
ncbi:MAG TPA: prolipoprotein diacylglyceryl transferase, partial [Gammaproteobacteria bacterium]|nr:prolipoprotein diacylglyceryl transferase [Gammaproteobacteria bacterium]